MDNARDIIQLCECVLSACGCSCCRACGKGWRGSCCSGGSIIINSSIAGARVRRRCLLVQTTPVPLKSTHTHTQTTTHHTPQSPLFLSLCVSIVSLCVSFHSVHLNLHSRVLHHRAIYSDTLSTEKTNILHRVAGQEGNSR